MVKRFRSSHFPQVIGYLVIALLSGTLLTLASIGTLPFEKRVSAFNPTDSLLSPDEPSILLSPTSQTQTFFSSGSISIPTTAGANGSPYPTSGACANAACINVSGMVGAVQSVTLTFNNWSNTGTQVSASNLALLLQSPAAGANGASALDVMSNACLNTGTNTFTLSDLGALNAVPNPSGGTCFAGASTMKPTTQHFCCPFIDDVFSAPGPATYQRAEPDSNPVPGNGTVLNQSNGHGTFSYVFNGMASANGVWKLYVTNQAGPASGAIGSWSLTITTAGAGISTTTAVTSDTPDPSFTSSSPVTLTAQVTPASGGPVNTGSVLFHTNGVAGLGGAGAADLGTVAVNASGVATLSNVQFTTEGAHQIVATYLGGGSFAASSASPAITHEVIKTSTAQVSPPAGTVGFCNTGGVTLPSVNATGAFGPANPYPSSVVVSGQSGLIQNLRVYLNGLTAANPAFVGFLLVGPNGKTLDFATDTGGSTPVTNLNLLFDDAALSQALPVTTAYINNGFYKPTAAATLGGNMPYCQTAVCNSIPVSQPAPALIERAAPQGSPARTLNQQFAGASPNGTWQLFAYLRGNVGTESLTGWCVNFTTTSGTATTTTVSASPNPSLTGAAVAFDANVVGGVTPVNEGSVIFTDSVTGSTIGTVSVVNGHAILSNVANLAEGNHTITASYNGTANFGFSSGSVTQRVNNPTVQNPAGSTRYCNQASAISIPANGFSIGASAPYPSNVIIANQPGTINSVEIDLNTYSLVSPQILQNLLVGPCQGASCSLDFFSHPPEASPSNNINLAFADAFALTIPNSAFSLPGGNYRPYSSTNANTYPAPAPAGPYNFAAPIGTATLNGIFANGDPNGTWSLYPTITTGAAGAGSIQSWCVNLTINKPTLTTTVSHSGPGPGNAFVVGRTGTYTIAVGNSGPGSTAGAAVTLSNPLPTGMTQSNINGGADWNCGASTSTVVNCTSTTAKSSGSSFSNIVVTVTPAAAARPTVTDSATASGFSMNSGNGSNGPTTVLADTTTGLTSSQNPSLVGQSVTFTATLAVNPVAVAPTGSVQFLDGGVAIPNCSAVALSGLTAQCTVNNLSAASHTITAVYAGDGNTISSSGSLTGNPQVVTNTAVWTGAASADWNTAANWSTNGLPSATNLVTIPTAGVTNNPSLQTANATVADLTIQSGRTLGINAGRALTVSGALTNNGTLRGTGTLINNFSNAGTVAPGFSPGVLNITGNYANPGALDIEIGGTGGAGVVPNGHDELLISGTATLGGTLNVGLTNGFTPAPGNIFVILDAASSTGTFATVNLPNIAPNRWDVVYNNALGTVTLNVSLPTAAPVAVAGRVIAPAGRGVFNARVTLTDANGQTFIANTNSFGYYRIADVEAGQTVVIGVTSKRFRFSPQIFALTDSLDGVNFTALP